MRRRARPPSVYAVDDPFFIRTLLCCVFAEINGCSVSQQLSHPAQPQQRCALILLLEAGKLLLGFELFVRC